MIASDSEPDLPLLLPMIPCRILSVDLFMQTDAQKSKLLQQQSLMHSPSLATQETKRVHEVIKALSSCRDSRALTLDLLSVLALARVWGLSGNWESFLWKIYIFAVYSFIKSNYLAI